MQMKHTPGPWEVNGPGEFEICDLDLIRITANVPISEDGPKRTLADARLIAAAPELLAALQSVYKRLEDILSRLNDEDYSELDTARAAIAKATGPE